MAVIDFNAAYQYALQAGASPDEARTLAAIAGAESSYNTDAHNDNPKTGDNSYGLWQINMLGQMGQNRAAEWGLGSYDDLKDPVTNARAALSILRSQGWNAWTTFTSGAYKQYLDAPASGAALGAAAGAASQETVQQIAAPEQASQASMLLGAAGAAGGQQYAALTSQHGDTLGDRLQSVLAILKQGPMNHV